MTSPTMAPDTLMHGAPSGLELRHIRAFVAVVEEASFTRGANRLSVTQPALSRTIAQMERLLGHQLIHRTQQGLEITAAGARFLPHARRILIGIGEGARALEGERQVLRIGFTWGAASRHIGPIVRAFEKKHPNVDVQIRRFDQTLAGLADGRSHLGFLPGQSSDPDVESLVLQEEPRVAALPSDHPLTSRRTLQLRDLAGQPIVINVVSGTTSLDMWPADQRPLQIVRVRNVDEWLEAVAIGRGIGTTAASAGQMYTHPRITYRHVTDAPLVPITLVWRKTETHPLVAEFISTAHSHQDGPGPVQ